VSGERKLGKIFIGCAGWSIRRELQSLFPDSGTHLERYAQRLLTVEINSSFYRPHQAKTYARWADSTPDPFRFAVKCPRTITHDLRLRNVDESLQQFVSEIQGLGSKLGPVLVQLPPSLKFERAAVETFLRTLRTFLLTPVACEPRHVSWFSPDAEAVLNEYEVARVAADPHPCGPESGQVGGWSGLRYFRLHGSPRMYYSAYDDVYLQRLAEQLIGAAEESQVWCIFDNTAAGAAIENALDCARRCSVN